MKTYQEAKNMFENSRKRKLANNTYLEKIDNHYGLRLHNTVIIEYYPDKIVLNTNGYFTQTTKARLNEFTPFNIWQEKGLWHIGVGVTWKKWDSILFKDNCYYNGQWHNTGSNPKTILKLRKQARQYAKDYTMALFKGEVPEPSTGDCWHCYMVEVETKRSLGEAIGNPDHILNHFKEKYYVPSLLVNAIKTFPVSRVAESCLYYLWTKKDVEKANDVYFSCIAKEQIKKSIIRYCYRQLKTAS